MTQQSDLAEALEAETQWEAEDCWLASINQRLNHATALLDNISGTLEAVDPGRREHVADLLDTAIEPLQRLQDRFGPSQPEDDPHNPPF